jgi:hypothetical protein
MPETFLIARPERSIHFAYYVGLDLGQSADYTALAIIEEPLWSGGLWVSPAPMACAHYTLLREENLRRGRPSHPPLEVRHLERFELGTPYTAIVDRVREIAYTPPLVELPSVLLVDKTGVGAAVLDAFEQSGVRPMAITIHGGSTVSFDPHRRGYRVPKRDLVSAVQVLLQNRRLKIAAGLPEASTLKKELLNFRVKVDPATAHDSYEHWREGDHDDLVLATAMTCWFREARYARTEARFAREERNRLRTHW